MPDEWSQDQGEGLRDPGFVTFGYRQTAQRFAAILQLFDRRENLHWRATFKGVGSCYFVGFIKQPGGFGPGTGEVIIRVSGAPRLERE